MANAYKCDRCSGYYDDNRHKFEFRVHENCDNPASNYWDLCPKCHQEFRIFLGIDEVSEECPN